MSARYPKEELLKLIKGKLIVSCQALPGEPLYRGDDSVMYLFARAAKEAGSPCIRTNGIVDVKAIKAETGLPVIGIIKKQYPGYQSYITPTMREVDELYAAGADIIALDCTKRPRGDGLTPAEYLGKIRRKYPEAVLMADISTLEEGITASEAGADLVSTTMSGYTEESGTHEGPDFQLVSRLAGIVKIPVIAEGKIHTPEEAWRMIDLGAYAVVVGGAITRPLEIARRFVAALR